MYQWRFNISSMQLPIQTKALALCPYCNLQHRNTVKCQPMVGEGGMSGERPICNYFLLNQHKVAALQCSTLAWIKTTCGAGWRKALAQQAPKESAAPFPCKFPRLFDIVRHLIVKEKKIWALGITAIYGFNVDWDKSCESDLLWCFYTIGWNVRRWLVKNNCNF